MVGKSVLKLSKTDVVTSTSHLSSAFPPAVSMNGLSVKNVGCLESWTPPSHEENSLVLASSCGGGGRCKHMRMMQVQVQGL